MIKLNNFSFLFICIWPYLMNGIKRQITIELSTANSELITKYDREMVRQSIAIATRQKHLRTLLGLSRMLQKNDVWHLCEFCSKKFDEFQ